MDRNHRVVVGLRIKPPAIADAPCPHADKVFWKHTNKEIYDEFIHPHTASTEFSTVFTYGRTGSGKTYTMFGGEKMPGVAELMLTDILKSHNVLTVRCTEIYNEVATDLFTGVQIRIVQENNAIRIISETQVTIKSVEEIKNLLRTIDKKRKTSETEHNLNSSRSHTVIEINAVDLSVNLVDLAGNEKMAEDLARRKEGLMINKSLLTLGKVIDQLHTDTQHVSYRESKLTRILQNTLSYGTIVCICTVIDLSDHLTIKFAERLKRIKTMERAIVKSKDEIINDLTQKIAYLTEQLQSMHKGAETPLEIEARKNICNEEVSEVFDGAQGPESSLEKKEKEMEEKESGQLVVLENKKCEPSTAHAVIENMAESENGGLSANLYEMIYKYLKVEAEQEMSNTLTQQEMDQVHVTIMKRKKGLLHGTPFHSIFKLSRTEMRSSKSDRQTEDK
ncbi:centromeric protein E [Nematocida minor]|uniref:centromeric protein E n=1 Tax=Nematocida minor TaxID=1912983 RepID=UPI00221FA17A|nr:centromeric protein E [Nematocida minor]KAI5192258.1 centromeric protein E [Nematocida minor]